MINNKLRWDPYLLFKGKSEVQNFLNDFVKPKSLSTLFIIGKGFDLRMNNFIKLFKNEIGDDQLNCILIDYNEGPNSPSNQYSESVKQNVEELKKILPKNAVKPKKMEMWSDYGRQRRRVSSINAAFLFDEFKEIEGYDCIYVDISSMPRSIYFAVVGKLLFLIDSVKNIKTPNLFVAVSENAKLDANIIDTGLDEFPVPVHGFDGNFSLVSISEKPLIWLPILGENKKEHLNRTFQNFENPPDEICPIVPFPSVNPRRGDNLLIEYHDLIFDKFLVEKQNLIHGSEQNPFEIYRKISLTLKEYFRTLELIGGCKAAISAYSSKLLSIGGLLASYEFNNSHSLPVGLINIESQGYEYIDKKESKINSEIETFLVWLTGEPYEE